MTTKKIVFAVNSYLQASQTIKSCKIYNIDPILYIKYFIINGYSPSWVEELNIQNVDKQFAIIKKHITHKSDY